MAKRPLSIQTHLSLLAVACIVPVSAALVGLEVWDYYESLAKLKDNTLATTRNLALVVDQRVLQLQAGLTALATSPALRPGDLAEFDQQAREVQQSLGFSNLVLFTPQGSQVINTFRPFGTPSPPAAAKSPLLDVFKTGKPVVTNLYRGALTGSYVVATGVPVIQDDKVIYALTAGLEPGQLSELLVDQHLPEGWLAAVVDREGVIIARSTDAYRFVGKKGPPALVKRVQEVTHDVSEDFVSIEGIRIVTVFSRAPISGWTVIIGIPLKVLAADLTRALAGVLVGILLLLGASLLLAWYLSRSIVGATTGLAQAAGQLGRGEPVVAPVSNVREAVFLGRALERAGQSLQDSFSVLANKEQRLSAVLQSAKDGIIVLDEGLRVVLANPAAALIFGRSPERLAGFAAQALLAPAFRDQLETLLRTLCAEPVHTGDRHTDTPVYGLRANGQEFPMEMSAAEIVEGSRRFMALTLRDVTGAVKTSQALLRSNTDLQQFAFVASHDLRSPLRSIKGFLGMADKRYGATMDPKALDLIQRASMAALQMDLLTEDLLSYARLDAGPKPHTAIDTAAVVSDTLQLLDAQIQESGATVTVGKLPLVWGDRTQLVQVFQNLVGNAIKYRAQRPAVVSITAAPGGDAWQFTISDNGIGIDPKYFERVFEVFKRLHTAAEHAGNGIGLAICKRIIDLHGGRIWVVSQPGEGSAFHFTLPRVKGEKQ